MDKRYLILGGAVVVLILLGILLFSSFNKPSEMTTLNFVTSLEDEKNLADYIAAFETQNNAKINFQKIDSQNYELDSLNLVSAGSVDIWGIPNSWLPKQHNKLVPNGGALTTANYKNLYPEIISKENIINDKIYGLPLSLDALVLFVNNDVRSKNPDLTDEESEILSAEPTNWDTLTAKSRLLTQKSGGAILQAGAALGTENIAAAPDILTVLMLQFGAQMTDSTNTKATFNTSINTFGGEPFPGAAALDFFAGFGQPNNQNYSYSEKTIGDPLEAFTNSKAAFYIDYSAVEKDLIRLNPNLNYATKSLPQVKATKNPVNFISYETFVVPKTSKNQTLAWKFIAGLSQKDNLESYFEQSKKPPALKELQDASDLVSQAVETARSWHNPESTKVAQIFRDAISQVVSGKSAQTALDGAASQITNLLGAIQ